MEFGRLDREWRAAFLAWGKLGKGCDGGWRAQCTIPYHPSNPCMRLSGQQLSGASTKAIPGCYRYGFE